MTSASRSAALQAFTERQRLRLAIESGDLGVWTWDVASGRVEWSDRLHKIYGLEPGSFDGTYEAYLDLIHPEDRDVSRDTIRQNTSDQNSHHTLHRTITPDGDVRWVEGWGAPIVEDGELAAMTGVARDVTDRELEKRRASERAETADGLLRLSRTALGSRGLESLARRVARAGAGLVGAESAAAVFTCRDENLPDRLVGYHGPNGDWLATTVPVAVQSGRAEMVNTNPARSGSDISGIGAIPDGAGVAPVRSLLSVDLANGNSDLGGVLVFGHSRPDRFGAAEEELAGLIAGIVGLAARSELRFEQQRLAAKLLQHSLLPPREIRVDGIDICVRYHPGGDGLDVGGDWYDVIDLPGGRVGLAVGDVCGHGLEAAAAMGQFRHVLRALLQSGMSFPDAVGTLNQIALNEAATTVTLVYVEIDQTRSRLECWNCGHLPPVIVSPDGASVRSLETEGRAPMLGFLRRIEPRPTEDRLEPGELLLLYTDGLVERRGESIDVGLSRLALAFVGRSGRIDELCDELYEVLVEQGPDTDDAALVAIRRSSDEDA
ncbi:MAG: SpoIIE family protein phosphatase [Acidimicrobiales bacterium]